MRPRKVIVCVDENEQALSVRSFTLENRGYRVIGFTDPHAALECVYRHVPGTIDLLLVSVPLRAMNADALIRSAKRAHPGLNALAVAWMVLNFDQILQADNFVPWDASPVQVFDCVQFLLKRKRGPKPAQKAAA